MIPLSTLVEVLQEYPEPGFYDEDDLAAYIISQLFERTKGEIPQHALLTGAVIVIQNWLSQDSKRWVTTYRNDDGYTTELMSTDKGLASSHDASTVAETLIGVVKRLIG